MDQDASMRGFVAFLQGGRVALQPVEFLFFGRLLSLIEIDWLRQTQPVTTGGTCLKSDSVTALFY